MSPRVLVGDCREIMAGMDAASVDAIVADPPYGLEFMGKEWDRLWHEPDEQRPGYVGSDGVTRSKSSAFSQNIKRPTYRAGAAMQAWHESWAVEAFRVLKPGGHLLAFSGTRTSHRMVCAIEDAGFEIRDTLCWLYGSGFPKSLDVSKALDKAAGAGREVVGQRDRYRDGHERRNLGDRNEVYGRGLTANGVADITAPATDAARQWDGYGTALKPAYEPIIMARKPLQGSVASNVLRYGTGGLNIDGCRIGTAERLQGSTVRDDMRGGSFANGHSPNPGDIPDYEQHPAGRWPPNVCLSHHPECVEVGVKRVKSQAPIYRRAAADAAPDDGEIFGKKQPQPAGKQIGYADPDGYETVPAWCCHEDCPVAMLDAQSGERTSTRSYRGDGIGKGYHGSDAPWKTERGYGDTGGASRFMKVVGWSEEDDGFASTSRLFYSPKASRAERNAGLEGMPERQHVEGEYLDFLHEAPPGVGAWLKAHRERAGLTLKAVAAYFPSRTGGLTGCVTNWEQEYNRPTPDQWWTLKRILGFDDSYDEAMTALRSVDLAQCDNPYLRAKTQRTNHHPTVKPLALMRWLVRLVVPPGGVCLDPFAGSGTTGVACVFEERAFIGVEQDESYAEIARRKLLHAIGPLFAAEVG